MQEVICGDVLDVLPTLPRARMIFADPPDNLGVAYEGFKDKWPFDSTYVDWLCEAVYRSLQPSAAVVWWSYYWKWDIALKGKMHERDIPDGWGYAGKPFVWWYTFGQHQERDCGSCFRPLLRFSQPDVVWNTDDIREPSARMREYDDPRADPRGRVPGDVWDGVWQESRVCGTFKEKRKWHKNQHPEALIERMVRMSTKPGDLVIDMFAGTGTVNRVCQRLGRDCIGVEISPSYCAKIRSELGL